MTHWRILPDQYDNLQFSDWLQMADAITRERGRTVKRGMINSACNAWLMGAGGDKYKSLRSFCEHLGLMEKTGQSKEQVKAQIKRVYEVSNRVLEAVDGGRYKDEK